MKFDCGFKKGNNWFRYRTGGIIINNNKMLFVKSAIGDYYYMKILDEDLKLCKSKTDNGEQLVWLPLEEIALQEIKPTFLKENINNIINEKNIIHIIEERDR